eukprot:CAMPEP_0204270418 /NCGR_PEP_ID=MMETSP0468-20130131/18885_1 /ASSEMBLY_ACC=CAM_ASM_000383 /TAXON_ID=2969 /ORGANISM="Oxyrrhis marina" /LENGTH=291 /DNA_ID=CAMNT_0051245951 /DNA_START=29 /DNA_END=905 /DNA_ORIENTATION=-
MSCFAGCARLVPGFLPVPQEFALREGARRAFPHLKTALRGRDIGPDLLRLLEIWAKRGAVPVPANCLQEFPFEDNTAAVISTLQAASAEATELVRQFLSYPTIGVAARLCRRVTFRGLLVLMYQVRTTPLSADVLPPRQLLLLEALEELHKGSNKLTVAGRAWTKHVVRASDEWWGSQKVARTDPLKSAAGAACVQKILKGFTWCNVFRVPGANQPVVVEFRLPEGYGARWAQDLDGAWKFRGFLELMLRVAMTHVGDIEVARRQASPKLCSTTVAFHTLSSGGAGRGDRV